MFRRNLKVLMFGLVILASMVAEVDLTWSADEYERRAAYMGSKLLSSTVLCKADQLAAGGFWRAPGQDGVVERAHIQRESAPTYWSVSVGPRVAHVTRFNANGEAPYGPIVYTVESTPMGDGLLLIKRDRMPGESPEIISIDSLNSSFVYSSQHVNPFWNRANIWYGTCTPDGGRS